MSDWMISYAHGENLLLKTTQKDQRESPDEDGRSFKKPRASKPKVKSGCITCKVCYYQPHLRYKELVLIYSRPGELNVMKQSRLVCDALSLGGLVMAMWPKVLSLEAWCSFNQGYLSIIQAYLSIPRKQRLNTSGSLLNIQHMNCLDSLSLRSGLAWSYKVCNMCMCMLSGPCHRNPFLPPLIPHSRLLLCSSLCHALISRL